MVTSDEQKEWTEGTDRRDGQRRWSAKSYGQMGLAEGRTHNYLLVYFAGANGNSVPHVIRIP